MTTLEMARKDTLILDPEEFARMKKECPDEIESIRVLPPILGKSNDFGKVQVKLSRPRYEVEL